MTKKSGLFNLSWEEFEVHTSNTFKELFEEQHFSNVTLACDDGKQIEAHKLVLSTRSLFFKRMLIKNPHPHPLIYIKGVNFSELQKIVEFVYQGAAQVRASDLDLFLAAAKDLEIKGLVDQSFSNDEDVTENLEITDKRSTPLDEIQSSDEESQNLDIDPNLLLSTARAKQNWILQEPTLEKKDKFESSNIKPEKDKTDVWTKHDIKKSSNDVEVQSKPEERVKNLPCDKCEKKFSHISGLWAHKRSIHQGLYYTCNFCDKKTAQSSNLKRHMGAMHGDLLNKQEVQDSLKDIF